MLKRCCSVDARHSQTETGRDILSIKRPGAPSTGWEPMGIKVDENGREGAIKTDEKVIWRDVVNTLSVSSFISSAQI